MDVAWATKEQARAHWADAASLPDAVLDTLLAVATEQVAAYAPSLEPGEWDVSSGRPLYMLATVYQAREVYAASTRDSQDVIGFGDFAIRARPLTAAVKSLLRPQRGVKAVG